ncbi:hypothetical protein HYU15_00765 [Candidatus Woesearchaeota archaeon]|nr:hypothetical protein [Candidatus Woesearchaeota archaeon]
MTQRKAQARMLETVAVIIVFFVLLTFGFVFYARMQQGAISDEARELRETKALKTAKTALSLPELQCSKTQAIENCLDKLKIEAFRDYASDTAIRNRHYYDLFKESTIAIEQVYPEQTREEIYSRPRPGRTKQSIWLPVTMLDPVKDTTSFGILVVDVYE